MPVTFHWGIPEFRGGGAKPEPEFEKHLGKRNFNNLDFWKCLCGATAQKKLIQNTITLSPKTKGNPCIILATIS